MSPRWLAVIPAVVLLGVAALVLLGTQKATDSVDPLLQQAVRTAIMTDMTIGILPAGSTAGHFDAAAHARLHDRVAQQLPTVYAGSLLTTKLQALSTYLDAAASNDSIAVNTDAGITSLAIQQSILSSSHATVHGTYSAWVTGRHKGNGAFVDDRAEASYTFTAGLDLVKGTWLVSSWDDLQTK